MTKSARVDAAFNGWVHRSVTNDMRVTASEWYDGSDSAMYRLRVSSFRDDVVMRPEDFVKLVDEANEVLEHLSEAHEQWRPRIEELRDVGTSAGIVVRTLSRMERDARKLFDLGLYDVEVCDVVESALIDAWADKYRRGASS